jgi:hypothetical protein
MDIQREATPADRISRLRRALYDLRTELGRLLEVFWDREAIMPGSIYDLRRKCGKTGCRCASGTELHSSTVISWSSRGRKRLRTVKQDEQGRLGELTRRYQVFRKARARLLEVQAEMVVLVDKLEAARREEP